MARNPAELLAALALSEDNSEPCDEAFLGKVISTTATYATVLPDTSPTENFEITIMLVQGAKVAVDDRVFCVKLRNGGAVCLGKLM